VFGKYGLVFVFGNDWDVSRNVYHGAALLVGTLITSANRARRGAHPRRPRPES
jgi:ABC-type phosphate transport system permease subunit